MKKGFTLVEMLIVVVIVGILMLIWLWLNRNQLAQLKAATVVEEVHTSFDEIFLQILNSSSHQAKDPNNPDWPWIAKPYSALELVIPPKTSDLDAVTQTSQSDMLIKYRMLSDQDSSNQDIEKSWTPLGEKYELTFLSGTTINGTDEEPRSPVIVRFTPFQTSCEIFPQGTSNPRYKSLFFTIKPKGWNEASFSLQNTYCRLAPQSSSD